jgi:acyl-CoA synthetase (AMP-forming)/AMP-acid ligase II
MFPGTHAAATPDKPAVIQASSGQVTTYAQLDAAANRLARLLRAAGLRPGDHVAFCLENHPRFHEVAWGCHYAGLVYTAASSRLTTAELAYIVNDCEAKAFITSAYKADQAKELVGLTPGVQLRLMLDATVPGYEAYEKVVAAQPETALEGRREGTDMLYSSGTTGRPKGVYHPPPDAALGEAGGLTHLLAGLFRMNAQSVYLSPAPLYHSAPLRFTMGVHRLGGATVVMDRFDPEQFMRLVQDYAVTHTQVVPTMFVRMLKLPQEVRERYDVSTLQLVVHAAAPCPVDVKRRMIEWWGPVLEEYYAGTEGNGFVYCNSPMWLGHTGTVGKPLNCVIHICDELGNEVPTGEEGTIYFEGGATFEYHNDPEKTRESRHPRGWSTLGDVGRLDEDGYLYLTDRKAHMIISGGVNIYPQEAENVLTLHPKVFDVAVIGVPNPDLGEEVKAVVQPLDWADAGAALADELVAYCRQHLADVKCPRSVDFERELPRHPTGKLYKRLLRDRYWEGRASRLV